MNFLLIQASEEASKSLAYKIGYNIGYFVGSNFYETLAIAVLVAAVIIYFAFFRSRRNRIEH